MSHIFENSLSTPEVLELFSEGKIVEAMLRFEASLARAQASVGLIPAAAAQSIIGTCKVELFDVAKIVREISLAGSIDVPLLKSLKETVGIFNKEAAGFVHLGCSSQDVVDTALALVTREALVMIVQDVHKAVSALLALAERHAAVPVLARTLMPHASVTSFGLICTDWAAPLVRSLQRLQSAAANALCVQCGGAVGDLAGMEKNGKNLGSQVMARMATELKLRQAPFAGHTQRDEWVALGCEVALLVGSLGKIAKDVTLMAQYEVGELAEPLEADHGSASLMPPKCHPVLCSVALAAAQRAPQRVAVLLAAMPQEHERALGHWQVELAEWPGLLMSAHGASRAMAQALSGLQINTSRMGSNLDSVRVNMPLDAASECLGSARVEYAATLARKQVLFHRAALASLSKIPRATQAREVP